MKITDKKFVFTAVLMLCAVAVRADVTNSFTATANAWVYRGSSSSVEDASQALQTKQMNNGNARMAYVRFNIASFLSNTPVVNITSARLKLYSQGSGTKDSLEVFGLNNTNLNGVPDSAWTSSSMTWNNQPAKTAAPNDIPSSSSALPNANTSVMLSFAGFGTAAQEVDCPLTAADFQIWLLGDTNGLVTFLFVNANANDISWASISNTNGYLVPTLEIVVSPYSGQPPRSLTWAGTPNGIWDVGTNANWETNFASPNTIFNQADNVTFDDSLTGTSVVTLAQNILPGSITVSNSVVDYTFSGGGSIGGITGLTKTGTGTLTINTANSFNGGIVVAAGTLKAGNNNALGAGNGSTTISNGATLDVGGKDLESEPIFLSGAGVSSNGVVINSGSDQIDALSDVTLLGDVTFGGSHRWDIRGGTLSSQGQLCKITKISSNQISITGDNVDSGIGDIAILSGLLSIETSTTSLGNPTNTISVTNGATLQFYQIQNVLNKKVLLYSGATLVNYSGLNTFGGPINLAGSATLNMGSGSSLELTNAVSGVGSLTKTGSGILQLDGTNTYTGNTTISSGEFDLRGQLIGGGTLTTSAGTIFAPNGGTSGTTTIGGAIYPNDLTGIGTFNSGNLTMNSGATATFEIRTNGNDLLQVAGNLTLNNNTITIVPLDNLQTGVPYTLATYTGTRSGTFNSVLNLDTNFSATLDYSTPGQVNLIFSRVETFTIPSSYPTGPGPMNVTMGPDGKLIYWPDTNGDTIPDFSQAGYMGGGVPIPTNIPIVTTLSPVAGDNQPQIQNAIDALSVQPLGTNGFRGVIFLNPGIYYMSNGLSCTASGIILRGSGCATNGTLLRLYQSHVIWTVNNPSGVGRSSVPNTQHNITSQYVPLGANWFQVDSVANWSVGDDIVIFRPSTALWCQVIDTAVQYPISWTGGEVNLNWERKIVAIEGNRIKIDAPILCAIDQLYGGGYVYKYTYTGRVQNVGLEDIRADCMGGVDDNGNTAGEFVTFDGVMNCWVRRCMNDKMGGHTTKIDGSKWCTFEDIISFHNPLPAGHSGPSIQINTFGTSEGMLFHRFTTSDGGFEFSSEGQSQGPNVILECDIPHSFASTSPHMKWTVGTLYDSMFMHQGLICLDAGGSHGWCGGNHLAWNDECGGFDYDRPVTAHQGGIGVVSSSATWDPNRTGTLPPEMISWQTHVDPRSLYRQQLAERIGAQKVLDALGQPYGDNYFLLTAQTNSVSAAPGQSASVPVTMTTVASYPGANFIPNPAGSVAINSWPNSNVNFSVSGLPWNCGASFISNSLNSAGTNVLNLIASNNAPVGSYWVLAQGSSIFPNIRGGNSPLNQFSPILLNVTGPNNFLLAVTPAGQSVFANTNTSFTVKVSALNGFTGPVALSITNLPPGMSASFSPAIVTGAGSSMLTLTISNNAGSGNFTMTILGSNGGLVSGATANLNVISTALPSPWVDADIGSQTNKGSASYFNNVFTGIGGGSDVWSTADQFNYIFQPQSGDFAITARVISQTAADVWSKAGVMIRETTNSNSKYIFAMISPTVSHGASLQYRTTTGGSAADAGDIAGPAAPYWVRLVRSGDNFTAFMSGDGVSWTQMTNSVSISMASGVEVGLAVCAHSSSALSTVTFDNVSIDYPYFTLNVSPATQTMNGNDSTSYTVGLQNNFGFSGNVTLSADGLPPFSTATFSPASINGTNISTVTVTTTNITPPDTYNLGVIGTNGLLLDEEFVGLIVSNSIDSDADGIPDWWMQQTFGHATGLAGDNSRAQDDFDGDGMANWKEYLCGTDPTDPTDYLHLLNVTPQGSDEAVSWAAIGGINYVIQSATNLANGFSDISPVITPDNDGPETYVDSGAATNLSPRFYRVRLGP